MSLLFNGSVSENPSFFVADFATLSDERRSLSKIFRLFNMVKEPCVRKFEGLARSKLLGISQTKLAFLLLTQYVMADLLHWTKVSDV